MLQVYQVYRTYCALGIRNKMNFIVFASQNYNFFSCISQYVSQALKEEE